MRAEAEAWYHVAFADRPGVFSRSEAEAVRVAETMGAQFVQQRFGQRDFVWPHATDDVIA